MLGAIIAGYTFLAVLLAGAAALSTAYLLVLLVAATWRETTPTPPAGASTALTDGGEYPQVVVLIPAHDEEAVLGATLASLREQCYPRSYLEWVVVADNCTDRTAEIARQSGATVLERTDLAKRGKGYALNWAVSALLARECPPDLFLIVDADTWVAPDFVRLMVDGLRARQDDRGCCALQGRYGVLNVNDGWRATLMAAAFELVNHVRPLGTDRLGFSVGLKGNGMGFTREVLERAPWEGRSITEDIDYGLDLQSRHGIRVGYLPQARVLAQMPVTAAQAVSQRERWERGRYALLRERLRSLLVGGVRDRDLRRCETACQLLVPPLTELCGLILAWGVLLAAGSWLRLLSDLVLWWSGYAAVTTGLVAYVLGGLAVAEAPREVFGALLRAPVYALWKSLLYLACLLGGRTKQGAAEWVRTERLPISKRPTEGPSAQPAQAKRRR